MRGLQRATALCPGSGRRPDLLRALLIALGYIALAAYRYDMTGGSFRNSDDAGNYLAGQAVAAGNWQLHGWILATDNYWPTDILAQALLRLAFGVHPILMKVEEGLVWAAIGVLGAALACRDATPRQRPFVLCLALALLSFNVFDHGFDDIFLTSIASHGMTILVALATFAVATPPLARWGPARAALLCGLETVGSLSDPIFDVIACLPLLALGGLGLPPRAGRREAAIRIAATLVALALAHAIRVVNAHNGGFRSVPLGIALVPFPVLLDHVGFGVASVVRLLGAAFYGRAVDASVAGGAAITLLRAPLAVAFAIVCALAGADLLRRIAAWPHPGAPRPQRDLEHLLLLGLVLGAAGACVTDVIYGQSCARFFYPTAVMGSILVARLLGRLPLTALYGAVVLAVSIPVGIAAVPVSPAASMTIPQLVAVMSTLDRLGLHHGYGGYFEGTIVTAMTRGRIESVALADGDGHLTVSTAFADLARADATRRDWHGPVFFVVANQRSFWELSAETVAATFGPPRRRIDLGLFDLMIYDLAPGELLRIRP